jgi:hypothetical protein
MAVAADRKILLKQIKIRRHVVGYCSICGKRLKFSSSRISEYPLSCWKCMVLNADY